MKCSPTGRRGEAPAAVEYRTPLTPERGERGGAAAAPAGAQASAGSASRAELGEGENSDRNIIGN